MSYCSKRLNCIKLLQNSMQTPRSPIPKFVSGYALALSMALFNATPSKSNPQICFWLRSGSINGSIQCKPLEVQSPNLFLATPWLYQWLYSMQTPRSPIHKFVSGYALALSIHMYACECLFSLQVSVHVYIHYVGLYRLC